MCNMFLTRGNQSQLAASAVRRVRPLITEQAKERATSSPGDFCGGPGANVTGKLTARGGYATGRCCRALTRDAASSLQRCWGWSCCVGKKVLGHWQEPSSVTLTWNGVDVAMPHQEGFKSREQKRDASAAGYCHRIWMSRKGLSITLTWRPIGKTIGILNSKENKKYSVTWGRTNLGKSLLLGRRLNALMMS